MEELNQCIEKAAELTHLLCGVTDQQGRVIACSDESRIHSEDQNARDFLLGEESFALGGELCYHRLQDTSGNEYACFISAEDAHSQVCLNLLSCWLGEVLRDGGTEINRESLLKNVLLENELPGDIPLKAREYRIPYSIRRTAVLVHLPRLRTPDTLVRLRELVPNRRVDYILSMDEENVVILKEVGSDFRAEVEALAQNILKCFEGDGQPGVCIGIGMPAETLKDCAKSYREASLALTVGNIFEQEMRVMHYDKLGLGRLIYQLPATLCHMFLDEVFPHDAYENLDQETLLTISKFFENNLNGSETARQLFVHRNTLVYRLDKVQKITGLDLRNFDDAVLFKLASMVRKYLEKQDHSVSSLATRWWKA